MRILFLIIGLILSIPLMSQQIHVEDFKRVKKSEMPTDKHFALLDLYTNEEDFQFFIEKEPIPFHQGEGFVTLCMPHKTNKIAIKHSKYGRIIWKVPNKKGLKKKKRYQAYIHTESVDKEFQISKQWAMLYIKPERAVVCVDSVIHAIEDGKLALYLPIGKHACRVFSPFYKDINDTLSIDEDARLEKEYVLSPYYSYLTVDVTDSNAKIYIDKKELGRGVVHTGRIKPGKYHLEVIRNGQLCYDVWVNVNNAERKVIHLTDDDFSRWIAAAGPLDKQKVLNSDTRTVNPIDSDKRSSLSGDAMLPQFKKVADSSDVLPSKVTIQAYDAETEIWVNRERKAKGSWEGYLMPGFYSVSSTKEGLDSKTSYFWVESGDNVELNLKSPLADYGMLNVSTNVLDSWLFLNGIKIGKAPCVIQNLPAGYPYRVQLMHKGKRIERLVQLKANDIVNVKLNFNIK